MLCTKPPWRMTLSPGTELFERDSIKRNPWFKDKVKSPGLSNIPMSREILNEDDSQTVMALQAAMARKKGVVKTDLVTWLKKQSGNPKGLASIYSTRNRTNFHEVSYRN